MIDYWYDDKLRTGSDRLMWALLKMEMPMQLAKQSYEGKSKKMELTYFEMKNELKTAGFCYAVRESSEDEAWVVYYDVPTNTYMITDWTETKVWQTTIEELEATDWIIYRFLR